jgi:hypothetical protein
MTEKYIRDLSKLECFMSELQDRRMFRNPRGFLIRSKFDLFSYTDEIRKAVSIWKQLHPLLQSRITKIKADNGTIKYVYECLNESKDEISFLHYKSVSETDTVPWYYLIEEELVRGFDSSNSLLWRIKFVKLNDESNSYWFIMNCHHAITDGTNAYNIGLELLQIIEDVHYHNRNDTTGLDVHVHEYGFPGDPRNQFKLADETADDGNHVEPVIIPGCSMPTSFQQQNENNCESKHDGIFVNKADEIVLRVNDIVQQRPNHQTRYKIIEIDKDLFRKLLQKTKEHGAKLTAMLECAFAFALWKVHKQFSAEEPDAIKWAVTGSIRNYFDIPVDNYVMGGGQWTILFSNEFKGAFPSFDDFWSLAKEKSSDLHGYLNSRVYLKKESVLFWESFVSKFMRGQIKMNGTNSHFSITNLGALANSNAKEPNIKVEKYYSFLSKSKDDLNPIVFNSFCSVNQVLFWSLTYNSAYIGDEAMQFWVDSILEIFGILVE